MQYTSSGIGEETRNDLGAETIGDEENEANPEDNTEDPNEVEDQGEDDKHLAADSIKVESFEEDDEHFPTDSSKAEKLYHARNSEFSA